MINLQAKDIEEYNPKLIIDARSPGEFSESHAVGARNFYSLNNEERKEIGTIYKQTSKHLAKVKAASYICQNAARHILEIGKMLNAGDKILIYCAKGGLRSKSQGYIYEQIGYQVARLEKGYKSYRNFVLDSLDKKPEFTCITLFGLTGCGKTRLLKHLPSIDIEGLANHLGSSFGGVKGSQPSQKEFENKLSFEINKFNKEKFCFIEGESKKLGSIIVPSKLHSAMREGIGVLVKAPLEFRIENILQDYENISEEYFYICCQKISPYISKAALNEIIENFKIRNLRDVAKLLIINYYDKVYKQNQEISHEIYFDGDIEKTCKELMQIANQI